MTGTKKIMKTASLMVVATLLAKICGMLREILMANAYGTTAGAVAFQTATRLPLLLFDLVIGGVITASFIPVFNEYLQKDKKQAYDYASSYITMVFLITLAITGVGIAFARPLVSVLAPDLAAQTKDMASALSIIMFPSIIFTGLAFCFVGILQSFKRFLVPAVISLVSNLVAIIYFYTLNTRFGITGLAWAMLIGWSLQLVIQIPTIIRLKFNPFSHMRGHPGLIKSLKMALPILISTWVVPLSMLVTMQLASYLNQGKAVAALEYSNKLYLIVTGVFSFVITNLIFPYLSRAVVQGESEKVNKITSVALRGAVLVLAPVTVLFFVLARPIISVIYQRGQFSAQDVELTAQALSFYAVGMIGLAANEVLTKVFFAQKNSKTPMYTSVAVFLITVGVSFALYKVMGVSGLALAGAVGATAGALLNYLLMQKKQPGMFKGQSMSDLLKILLAAGVMGAAVLGVFWALGGVPFMSSGFWGQVALIVSVSAAGVVVYIIMCILLRVRVFLDNIKIVFGKK